MAERKRDFIRLLEKTIHSDKARNDVKSIIYKVNPRSDYPEIIEIKWEGGARMCINVAGNSNGANLKEVTEAVYGNGRPAGKIPSSELWRCNEL